MSRTSRTARRIARGIAAAGALSLVVPAAALAHHTDPAPDHDAGRPFWSGQPLYTEQDLALPGQGGFPNYRIPALTVTNEGTVLASYDGRPTAWDAPGPNSILQRRSEDNGRTWQEQTVVRAGQVEEPIEGYSDPSYIVDRETGHIFNFHVFSMDQGFIGSRPGVDPEDRNVLHANVSVSTDDGRTWEHRTITADITPDLSVRSRFAAAGQGIQLKYGEHAGRLIQQYTIINAAGQFQAVSIYSDDHGQTWRSGEPVGVGMDENKTVELSDGRVMLNSRDSYRSGYRKVAISEDGGVTYGEVTLDTELPDPTNNASIIRAYPNAEQGSQQARVLLFSNAGSQSGRVNGTVRASCDDGQTWPIAKVFQEGEMAYSTMATLPSGNIGMLYEPGHDSIRYAEFNLPWLEGLCAPLLAEELTIERGEGGTTTLTTENQLGPAIHGGVLTARRTAGLGGHLLRWPVGAAAATLLPGLRRGDGAGEHHGRHLPHTPAADRPARPQLAGHAGRRGPEDRRRGGRPDQRDRRHPGQPQGRGLRRRGPADLHLPDHQPERCDDDRRAVGQPARPRPRGRHPQLPVAEPPGQRRLQLRLPLPRRDAGGPGPRLLRPGHHLDLDVR